MSVSLGALISTATPSVLLANILAPIIAVVFILFGGFYVNSSNIPKWFIWVEWLSPIKYSFAALMLNDLDDISFRCSSAQLQEDANGNTFCPLTTGEQVLTLYGLDTNTTLSIQANLFALIVWIGIARVLGYIALRFLPYNKHF